MSPSTPSPNGADTDGGRELKARGRRTRARLLEAGATAFAEKGYHAARVDDIVAAAKTSHGTFYLYFDSKEALFDELVAGVAGELATLVDDLGTIRNDDDGRAALRGWLERFTELYGEYGPIIRTWTEAELSGEPAGEHGDNLLSGLVVALTDKVAIPKKARLDPVVAMLALVTMCERMNYYVATGQVKASRDELLDTLVGIIDDAVLR